MAKKFLEIIDLTKNELSTTTTTSSSKSKKGQGNQYVNWCATAYEHKFDDDQAIAKYLGDLQDLCSYLVAGRETCPKTKKIHFQMYFVLKKRMRLEQLKQLDPTVHYEPAKGTFEQNFLYCTKEDPNFLEFGEKPIDPGERERNRWSVARTSAMKGEMDAVDDQIFISYYKALQQIHRDNYVAPARLDHCCGVFLYGVPHSGKSHMARNGFGTSVFLKLPKIEWWDGYNFEDVVVIEDVTPALFTPMAIQAIKCWTDVYPFPVEVKGGNMKAIRPKLIVFTSNYRFEECFGGEQTESYKAMIRRFKIFHFPKAFNFEEDDEPYYCEHEAVEAEPGTVPTFHLPPGLRPSSAPVLAIDTVGGKLTLTRSDTIVLPPRSNALDDLACNLRAKPASRTAMDVLQVTPSPTNGKKKKRESPGAPQRVVKRVIQDPESRPPTPALYFPQADRKKKHSLESIRNRYSSEEDDETQEE